MARPDEWIARKRDGGEHSAPEIYDLVRSVADGSMPDYQTAAWLMAAYIRGLSTAETLNLTLAMRDSGRVLDLSGISGVKVDKHSSGGVGDKVSLVVVPILVAAGVRVLKMSGRGLGFSGGTIDKLESIPGFRTDIPVQEAITQVGRIGGAIVGQSADLVPADKRLYALRDVTATIDSITLIAASIMAKKLATGADAILLDVKVGRGAFMRTLERARSLAGTMVELGRGASVRTHAALTSMDEPLGYSIGNALEVREAVATLTGRGRVDGRFRELCVALAARALVLGTCAATDVEGASLAESILASGAAAEALEAIIQAQGGDPRIVSKPELLPPADHTKDVVSEVGGFVQSIDAEMIGRLATEMGAGRLRKSDTIHHGVGIVLIKKVGESVASGDSLAELHLRSTDEGGAFADAVRSAYRFGPASPAPEPVVYEFLG